MLQRKAYGFNLCRLTTGTWTEYFNSLLLHNILFYNTAYSLIGFAEFNQKLFAVIRQPFVEGEQADLEHIEEFLNFNGFNRTRRQAVPAIDAADIVTDLKPIALDRLPIHSKLVSTTWAAAIVTSSFAM
jgi:hypothetical protein